MRVIPFLALLISVAGCVSLPTYDDHFDKSLSDMVEKTYAHFDAFASADPRDCTLTKSTDFWSGIETSTHILQLRASLMPRYSAMNDALKGLSDNLPEYQKAERDYMVSHKNAPCLNPEFAAALENQVGAAIGSPLKYELMLKSRDSSDHKGADSGSKSSSSDKAESAAPNEKGGKN